MSRAIQTAIALCEAHADTCDVSALHEVLRDIAGTLRAAPQPRWGLLVRDADGQYRPFDSDAYPTFEAANNMRRQMDAQDEIDGFGREALVYAIPPLVEIIFRDHDDTTGDDYAAETRLRLMESGL